MNTNQLALDALVVGRRALSAAIKSAWDGCTESDIAENHVIVKMTAAIDALEADIDKANGAQQ